MITRSNTTQFHSSSIHIHCIKHSFVEATSVQCKATRSLNNLQSKSIFFSDKAICAIYILDAVIHPSISIVQCYICQRSEQYISLSHVHGKRTFYAPIDRHNCPWKVVIMLKLVLRSSVSGMLTKYGPKCVNNKPDAPGQKRY